MAIYNPLVLSPILGAHLPYLVLQRAGEIYLSASMATEKDRRQRGYETCERRQIRKENQKVSTNMKQCSKYAYIQRRHQQTSFDMHANQQQLSVILGPPPFSLQLIASSSSFHGALYVRTPHSSCIKVSNRFRAHPAFPLACPFL